MVENTLNKIINKKGQKLNELKKTISIESLREKIKENRTFINFKEKIENNIVNNKISLIAEIKKASPSAGIIVQDYNPVDIAKKFDNLLGDDSEFNANKIINIFKGEDNDFSKAVCLNAAAGLIVSENHTKFIDAYQNAKEHILSGKTYEHLKNIQNG